LGNNETWDTHQAAFPNLKNYLLPPLDRAVSALLDDLHETGLLNETLIVMGSEFGRTPRINGHIGRDHWPEAWSIAMSGCGIQQGAVVGRTNKEGTWVDTEEYDIGHAFHTWFRALGIDPISTEYINHGQPLPIAHDDMSAIEEVLL